MFKLKTKTTKPTKAFLFNFFGQIITCERAVCQVFLAKSDLLKGRLIMEVGLQIFESEEFGEIRTLGDWENPKFCLVDVCRVLDLRVDNVVTSLKGDPYTAGGISLHPITDSLGRTQMVNFVDEPCLYRIIFTSRKPNALKFQDWIFRVVIPSLRKTGFYSLDGATAMPTIAECLPIKEEELIFLDANVNLLPLELHAVLEKLKFNSNMLAEIVKFASYCLPGEIWKPIKNFNGRYQVSTKGNVVSFLAESHVF